MFCVGNYDNGVLQAIVDIVRAIFTVLISHCVVRLC